MRVIRATAMGFCFGVRDALLAAERIAAPEGVTIHGEIVHNAGVNLELALRGFVLRGESDRDRVPTTERVLITAHGISDRERGRLESAGRTLIDTTCPLVRKAHEAALSLARSGRFVVVIGKRTHVEVEGLVGDLERFEVVERPEDVRCWKETRLGVVAQTTTPPELAQAVLEQIRASNPEADVAWIPSICRPTLERQEAVLDLLARVDALVVVGGRNSNNTRALVELARSRGVPGFHVASAEELAPEEFAGFETVGLTAGTSTPDRDVADVESRLAAIEGRERTWLALGRPTSEGFAPKASRREESEAPSLVRVSGGPARGLP